MARQIFHLAGKAYTVKEQIKAEVRQIANQSALNQPLVSGEFEFMRDLFNYHPQADVKIGSGIETIVVRVAFRNQKNREFWIKQVGSDEFIDISWTECLKATTALAEFRNACRLAVKHATQAFCDEQFASARTGLLLCPLTGVLFSRDSAHVDHDDPWPFRKIVDDFIEREGVGVAAVEYDGFEHGSAFIKLHDSGLASRFVTFHNNVVRLRVVSCAGNLKRTKVR